MADRAKEKRILEAGNIEDQVSKKEWLVTMLLCLFLGGLGVHRFYVGKIGTGILWFLTLGFGGIGTIIDFIMILTSNFTDSTGAYIMTDTRKSEYQANRGANEEQRRRSSNGVIHLNPIHTNNEDYLRGVDVFFSLAAVTTGDQLSELAILKVASGSVVGSYSGSAIDVSGEAVARMLGNRALLIGYDIRAGFPALAGLFQSVDVNAEWDYIDLKELAKDKGIEYLPKGSAYAQAQDAINLFARCR